MLSYINSDIIGPILPIVLFVCAVCLTFYLKLKPFRSLKRIIKPSRNLSSSLRYLCMSLAGTLGVGNIAGVASAITMGGAGSIFWMWLFGILSMIIKYSETVLALHYKTDKCGGAAEYIKDGLHKPKLSYIFSLLIIVTSIGVGNTVQSSAAAESMLYCFNIPKIITGIAFAVLTIFLITGGEKRVSNFSVTIIPVLTVGYIIFSLAIIIANFELLPNIIKNIFTLAFDFRPAVCGLGGYGIKEAIRLGASRGILSNEAGCGTSAYAHIHSSSSPVMQGLWGMIEVFIDTIVLCSLTAFSVLCICPNPIGNNGMEIAIKAYSYFGEYGGIFIGTSSTFYALASVVCWSFYGVSAVKYLGGKRNACGLYIIVYSAAGIVGSVFSPSLVWELSDFFIAILAIFNTACVLCLSKKVREQTDLEL